MQTYEEKRDKIFKRRISEVKALLKYYKTQEQELKADKKMSGRFRQAHEQMIAEGIEACELKLIELNEKYESVRV